MKLNYKRTLLVGLAFLSICAFWQLYDNVVPLILKNTFDIPDDIAGVIMALDNVLALFLLPLFGKLSDRTHTRLGRRMPYILGGTLADYGACYEHIDLLTKVAAEIIFQEEDKDDSTGM